MIIELGKEQTGQDFLNNMDNLVGSNNGVYSWSMQRVYECQEVRYKIDGSREQVGNGYALLFNLNKIKKGFFESTEISLETPGPNEVSNNSFGGSYFKWPRFRTRAIRPDQLYNEVILGIEFWRGGGDSHFHYNFVANPEDSILKLNLQYAQHLIGRIQALTS